MEQNNTDEIDLGIVFTKIQQVYTNFLISIYKGIQFLFNHWWKILIVAIIGAVIGYFLEENNEPNKETTIIVQNNFDSTNYVYDAIEQLNNKISEGDTLFLKEKGFYKDDFVLLEVEINPIIRLIDILEDGRYNTNTVSTLLEQTDVKDDLLASEIFRAEYRYHTINLITSNNGDYKTVNNLIAYLNDNPIFDNLKTAIVENTKERLFNLDLTLKQLNKILDSEREKDEFRTNQIYIENGARYVDLFELVKEKNNIFNQKERILLEMVKYDNTIALINKPELTISKSLLPKTKISIAFLFVFIYLFIYYFKKLYYKIKVLSK